MLASCGSTRDKENQNTRPDPKKIDPDSQSSGSLFSNFKTFRPRGELYQPAPVQPLVLPEDILNRSSDEVKAELASYDPEEFRILPPVSQARIVSAGEKQWLEVDSDVQKVWEAMVEYWTISGIDLVNHNPQAGLMETEWVKNTEAADKDAPGGLKLAKTLLHALTSRGDPLDRYRLRFERLGQNKTAVHVSHRSIKREEIPYGRKVSEFEWVELESDPEKIAEFLETIVVLFKDPPSNTS